MITAKEARINLNVAKSKRFAHIETLINEANSLCERCISLDWMLSDNEISELNKRGFKVKPFCLGMGHTVLW